MRITARIIGEIDRLMEIQEGKAVAQAARGSLRRRFCERGDVRSSSSSVFQIG